jgi:predicted deacylase
MPTALERRRIETSPEGPGLTLLDLAGVAPGPRLVVLGGVHGDEPQGVRGALAVARRLDGLEFRGQVRIVPVCHEAAFASASRRSPVDGLNLAREFSGDDEGSATQQLAALLDEAVLSSADILVDMHSAGLHYAMPTLVGYSDDGSAASLAAARLADAAGMPVVWRHPGPLPAGRTGTGPHARGVPFLYFESTDDRDQADLYADAILRIMVASDMLDDAPASPVPEPVRLVGPGDLDVGGVLADRTGLIELDVDVLDGVTKDQVLGRISSPDGSAVESVSAHADGVVVMRRRTSWLATDDLVAFLARPDPSSDT